MQLQEGNHLIKELDKAYEPARVEKKIYDFWMHPCRLVSPAQPLF